MTPIGEEGRTTDETDKKREEEDVRKKGSKKAKEAYRFRGKAIYSIGQIFLLVLPSAEGIFIARLNYSFKSNSAGDSMAAHASLLPF